MSTKPDWFYDLVRSMDMLDPLYRKVKIYFQGEKSLSDIQCLTVDSEEEAGLMWDQRRQGIVLTSRLLLKVTHWGYPQIGTRQLLQSTLRLRDVCMISIEEVDYDGSTTDKRLWVRNHRGGWHQHYFPLIYDQFE